MYILCALGKYPNKKLTSPTKSLQDDGKHSSLHNIIWQTSLLTCVCGLKPIRMLKHLIGWKFPLP